MLLAKIAKFTFHYLATMNFILIGKQLRVPIKWSKDTKENIQLGTFDVVLTNPPFGAKIPVVGRELLSQYQLGHMWENGEKWLQTKKLLDKQSPQVLFIER